MVREAAVISLIAAVPWTAGLAQDRFHAEPILGLYVPTSRLEVLSGTCLGGVGQCGTYGVTQSVGPTIGLRLLWSYQRVTLDLSVAYALTSESTPQIPNGLDVSGGRTVTLNTTIASTGVCLNLGSAAPGPYVLWGIAAAQRSGDATAVQTGAQVAVGTQLHLTRTLALRVEFADFLYLFGGAALPQNALALSLGLGPAHGRPRSGSP